MPAKSRPRLKIARRKAWGFESPPRYHAMDTLGAHQDQLPPFARLLGIRFLGADAERVTAELEIRADLCTAPAIAHGGALMAFADTLGAVATVLNLPSGASTTTLESKTNF